MIYGAGHLGIYPDYQNIRALAEAGHPGAFFHRLALCRLWPEGLRGAVGEAHQGLAGAGAGVADRRARRWKRISSGLGCNASRGRRGWRTRGTNVSGRNNLGLTSDGLLYLGPRSSLLMGPKDLDIYLDTEYRAEMDRRMLLRTGENLKNPSPAGDPSVPKPFW